MRIIAIANQKGGCGKTTTAVNLSSSLARLGKRVLIVDCDPQAHATLGLHVEAEQASMYNVLTPCGGERLPIAEVIVPIRPGFHLAPAGSLMGALEQQLAEVQGREHTLLEALAPVTRAYDFAILDCPPSIGHLCFNALRACSEVVIPIDMSLFSLRGVVKLVDVIEYLKKSLGHEIDSTALITMFDFRTRYARRVLEKVREAFGENVFETVIRYTVRLRESVDHGLPVGDFDRNSIGCADYERLAGEVIQKLPQAKSNRSDAGKKARHIVERAEAYFGSPGAAPENDSECFSGGFSSSYSDMIDMLAGAEDEFLPEDDELI